MPFGPRLKSIDCADQRQFPQRHCRKKGWMRVRIGLMTAPISGGLPERDRRCWDCSDQQSDFNMLQYGNGSKSFDPYLAASIKDANHSRKMGARRPHSAKPLIPQGVANPVNSGESDWRDSLSLR